MTEVDDFTIKPQAEKRVATIYEMALALIWHDRRYALRIYPLLVAVEIYTLYAGDLSTKSVLWLAALSRLFSLQFFYLLCRRHLVPSLKHRRTGDSSAYFLLWGMLHWALVFLPLISFSLIAAPVYQSLMFFSFPVGCLLALRYFFFFPPVLAGKRRAKEVLAEAGKFTAGSLGLPLRLMAAPLGYWLLFGALPVVFSPDGRSSWPLYVSALFDGTVWWLGSYISIVAALKILALHGSELYSPGRTNEYFEGLAMAVPKRWKNLLSPKLGVRALLVGSLVWAGNFGASMTVKPAPEIIVSKIEIEDNLIRLHLNLNDERYLFNGFKPVFFKLAGEQGHVVSPQPARVFVSGYDQDALYGLPASAFVFLVLEFETDRKSGEIGALKDLFLFYKHYRHQHLDMGVGPGLKKPNGELV